MAPRPGAGVLCRRGHSGYNPETLVPGPTSPTETAPMRAEIEAIAEEIKQILELLRRHL